MQSVFRVRQQRPARSLSALGNGKSGEYDEPAFHTRRPHKKSRSGCKNCKRRRIKCDEAKPSCKKCQDHRITCDYIKPVNSTTAPAIVEKAARRYLDPQTGAPYPSTAMYTMSLALAASSLDTLLRPPTDTDPAYTTQLLASMTPYVQNLQHFETVTYATVGSPIAQHVIKSSVLGLALSTPYLMHATLAVSATHLKHLLPAITHPVQHRQNALAESYHWQRALSLFQAELASPAGLGPHNMDPILSTSMLLAILSFSLDDFDPSRSFVFASPGSTADALSWLTIQSGLKTLLIHLQSHIPSSVWMPVFIDADGRRSPVPGGTGGPPPDERPGPAGLPPAFVTLCKIDNSSTIENNPYHLALRLLAPLLHIDAGIATFGKLITFMGRIRPEFYTLLTQKDHRALLILAYWFALMSDIKQWWIVGRLRSECVAICTFLRDNSRDPRIKTLLRFPASVVGVSLAPPVGITHNSTGTDEDVSMTDGAGTSLINADSEDADADADGEADLGEGEGEGEDDDNLYTGLRTYDGLQAEEIVKHWPPECAAEMRASGIDELAGPRSRCPVFRVALLRDAGALPLLDAELEIPEVDPDPDADADADTEILDAYLEQEPEVSPESYFLIE